MKLLIALLFAGISISSIAQISEKEKKKINKIIGEDFVPLKPQKSYPFDQVCKSCDYDTSQAVVGQIDGVITNNEFVMYRDPIAYMDKKEVQVLGSNRFVTNAEYQEFQNWVRDSNALELLVRYLYEEEDALKFVIEKELKTAEERALKEIEDRQSRRLVRHYYYFNWDAKFSYDDPMYIPIFAYMYVTQRERLHGKKLFDDRKWIYRYEDNYPLLAQGLGDSTLVNYSLNKSWNRIHMAAPVMKNKHIWASESKWKFDEAWVLAQLPHLFENEQVFGVNAFQAKAFCDWKEEMLQKEFNAKKLPYNVRVTLPTYKELGVLESNQATFSVPKRDYNSQWSITLDEYKEFMVAVKDSNVREMLYYSLRVDDEASKYLMWQDIYFSEGDLEFVQYDPSDRYINRELFPLDYSKKIKYEDPEIKEILEERMNDDRLNSYTYWYWNSHSQLGTDSLKKVPYGNPYGEAIETWYPILRNKFDEPAGKDLRLIEVNDLGEFYGIRAFASRHRQLDHVRIDVRPRETEYPMSGAEFIKSISYEQALAFYHWKYPIHQANAEDDWRDFVFPSLEQFQRLQFADEMGAYVPEERKVFNYPTPTFRYVVHLFPK